MIVPEAELVAKITRDRAAGKRIGVATLAFDLLRVEDVRRLQAADTVRGVNYVIACAEHDIPRLVALLMPDVRA